MVRLAVVGLSLALITVPAMGRDHDGWRYYGGDAAGTRYSSLAQIDSENVDHLQVAWVYRGKDVSDGKHTARKTGFEATPIVLGDTMYFCSGYDRVLALDPLSGRQKWSYDPHINLKSPYGDGLICRGVASWPAGAAPARRIFIATEDSRLIALDARTGKPEQGFGKDGQVFLGTGVGKYWPGEYHMTSAPTVVGSLVIVGSAIDDNVRAVMPRGVVRAYDVRTGALRWTWNPVPRGPEVRTGAANAWAPLSADPKRGLVFIPTGSASPDYYGGLRRGNDRYADSVVALHAATGKVAWAFQLVHHDLWDYDTTVQPSLLTVRHRGHNIPGVIAANKTGFLFLLDRRSGRPIFPVQERSVPRSSVPGEDASPTQPFPPRGLRLASTAPLRARRVWGLTRSDRAACRKEISGLLNDGIFTPPSRRGSLLVPGDVGGMAWGGAAVDPKTHLLYINVNDLPREVVLIPRDRYRTEAATRYSGEGWGGGPQTGARFGMRRRFLVGPDDAPCTPPPWGTLTAVSYDSGRIAWSVPLGSWSLPHPLPARYGSLNLGGPIATAGGLIFEGSTLDKRFRAFDASTGKLLWSAPLPYSSPATPMTYLGADGRQYVVIASGGHAKLPSAHGEVLVAFALPRARTPPAR